MPHSCRHRIAYKSLERVAAIKLHDKLFSLYVCWKVWCRFLSCCKRATTHSAKSNRVVEKLFTPLSFFAACILWRSFCAWWTFFFFSSLLFRVIAVDIVVTECVCVFGDLRAMDDTSFDLFVRIWFFDIWHRRLVGKLARNSEGTKKKYMRYPSSQSRRGEDGMNNVDIFCASVSTTAISVGHYDYDYYCRRVLPNKEREQAQGK